jgi:hypothetical protein
LVEGELTANKTTLTMAPQKKKQKTGKKDGKWTLGDDRRRSSRVLNQPVTVLNRENAWGQFTDDFFALLFTFEIHIKLMFGAIRRCESFRFRQTKLLFQDP